MESRRRPVSGLIIIAISIFRKPPAAKLIVTQRNRLNIAILFCYYNHHGKHTSPRPCPPHLYHHLYFYSNSEYSYFEIQLSRIKNCPDARADINLPNSIRAWYPNESKGKLFQQCHSPGFCYIVKGQAIEVYSGCLLASIPDV